MDDRSPHWLFSMSFTISSLAGVAALLRSGAPLTARVLVSAILNSGLFGLGIALVWYENYGGANHPWFMLGVSLLAGLGGTSLLDFAFQAIREGLRVYATRIAGGAPAMGAPTYYPQQQQPSLPLPPLNTPDPTKPVPWIVPTPTPPNGPPEPPGPPGPL